MPNHTRSLPLEDYQRDSIDVHGLIHSQMEVVAKLKGNAPFGKVQLTSSYWPKQGEYYLILGDYYDNCYQATEDFRVVPLGMDFETNLPSQKQLHEQIQTMFQMRLFMLNRQMKAEQEEKARLEDAFKK